MKSHKTAYLRQTDKAGCHAQITKSKNRKLSTSAMNAHRTTRDRSSCTVTPKQPGGRGKSKRSD
eukprot:1742240-Amphidinium_carterae.2